MSYDFYVMGGDSRFNVEQVGDRYILTRPNSEHVSATYPVNSRVDNWINTVEHIYEKVAATYESKANEAGASRYPDNFSFTHDTTTQMYDMVKLPYHNLWGCSMHGDTFGVGVTGATYTADEIAEHFEKGHWREVKAEEATKERDLVFPLIVSGTLPPYYRHRLTKGSKKSFVSSESLDGAYTKVDSAWTDEFVKSHIKEGHWIVEEVGSQEAPEASTSPSADNTALAIKIDSDAVLEATRKGIDAYGVASERFERLAQAIEAVNISLESFQSVFADVQDMLGSNRACEAEDTQGKYFDFSSFIKCT